MIYDGFNGGLIEVLDDVIVIRRKGVASFFNHGLKGDKRIPYESIMSVQFKEPGLTTGYIQFGLAGGLESRGGVTSAVKDENTVLFTKKALNKFRELRDLVEWKSVAARRGPAAVAPQRIGVADELSRLAELRDKGVLTEEEFALEKAKVLSRS